MSVFPSYHCCISVLFLGYLADFHSCFICSCKDGSSDSLQLLMMATVGAGNFASFQGTAIHPLFVALSQTSLLLFSQSKPLIYFACICISKICFG